MTHKDIDTFLVNTKVYVNGKSAKIQEKLFSFGYEWNCGNIEVNNIEFPFLYILEDHNITYGCDMCNFMEDPNREIFAEEILSLELTESEIDETISLSETPWISVNDDLQNSVEERLLPLGSSMNSTI